MKASKAAVEGFLNTKPFNTISVKAKTEIANVLSIQEFEVGERLCREDELPNYVYLVVKGKVRLLAKSNEDDELITISRRGIGQYIGWVSLLRGEACETVHAIETTTVISIPAESFVQLCLNEKDFLQYFSNTTSIHENWRVLSKFLKKARTHRRISTISF